MSSSERSRIEKEIFHIVSKRSANWAHFFDIRNFKLVYRQYIDLVFAICVDETENELAIYEVIHILVRVLDGFFNNVCELDIVHNFDLVHQVVDEMIVAGEISNINDIKIAENIKETRK